MPRHTSRRTRPRRDDRANMVELDVRPIAGALGAEIHGVDLRRMDDAIFAAIHQVFLDYLVVFLPGQVLTPKLHSEFAARFGNIDMAPFTHPLKMPLVPGHPEILNLIKEADDQAINQGGLWHSDVTFREQPHMLSVIHALDSPSHGGDTMFANQYLAFETLSEGMKRMLGGLDAVHSSAMPFGNEARSGAISRNHAPRPDQGTPEASVNVHDEPVVISEVEHPVVRTHPETARKALYVSRAFTTRFAGMSEEESRPLLDYLWEHAVRPEFTCRYHYDSGCVGIWDNRCAQHYALNDYYGERRHMQRIAVHGDRPV
jgi:taurine dioxygenase